jgi:hypothetical protein
MKRTIAAFQQAPAAAGARPCAHAYGRVWALEGIGLGMATTTMQKSTAFGTNGAPALGRPPR